MLLELGGHPGYLDIVTKIFGGKYEIPSKQLDCALLCGACGAMDNASDYGSEDSRFESWQARMPDFESGPATLSSTEFASKLGTHALPERGTPYSPYRHGKCQSRGFWSSLKGAHFTQFHSRHSLDICTVCLARILSSIAVGKNKTVLAERGFDPRTSGLWAQHASTAPLCFTKAPGVGSRQLMTCG